MGRDQTAPQIPAQNLDNSNEQTSTASDNLAELSQALKESMGNLRSLVPENSEQFVAFADQRQPEGGRQQQGGAKGVGAPQQIQQEAEYFVVSDSIKQLGSAEDARRDNKDIAREDYGIEVSRKDGKGTLNFTQDNTSYPLTDATLQVGVHRQPGGLSAQVNVVDKMKDGVISVDRISVNGAGAHSMLETMKISIAGPNPEKTVQQLQELGITLKPEVGAIEVSSAGRSKAITLGPTSGEVKISLDERTGKVTVQNIEIPGQNGATVQAAEGVRVAQDLVLDTKRDNEIHVSKEYQVDTEGQRLGQGAGPKTNFEVHPTTALPVRNDVSFNANRLAELKPGEVIKSGAGIEWKKDNDGNLYYNTNGNQTWGRLDREEAYSTALDGRMHVQAPQEGFADGFADDIMRARERVDKPEVKPHNYELDVSDPVKVAQIFNHGFSAAQEYAQSNGYQLGYKPSGVLEKGIQAAKPINVAAMKPHERLDRIELQEVWAQKMEGGKPVGDPIELGLVRIQDKTHLTGPIASPEKIANDIHAMMKEKLEL